MYIFIMAFCVWFSLSYSLSVLYPSVLPLPTSLVTC